jgi:hypothetical protein
MTAKTYLGVALIVLAACLAGGGVYALHTLKQKKADPNTLCPLEGPKSVTSIIIDKTDPLTAFEQARIKTIVQQERDALPPGGRIAVKLLRRNEGTSETGLDTIADLCNPGSEANPLFENPKRVAARYSTAFAGPIDAALESASMIGSAPASPIASAIAATIEDLPRSASIPVKLVLISDLMEHTALASAYAGTLSEASLRKLISPAAQDRLKTLNIHIVLLARPRHAKQQEAAVAIWLRFFGSWLGRELQVIRL